jgi:hypothetical protein
MLGYMVDTSQPKARTAGVEFDVISSTRRLRAQVSYQTLGAGRDSRSPSEWESLVRGMSTQLQKLVDDGQRNGSCGAVSCLM